MRFLSLLSLSVIFLSLSVHLFLKNIELFFGFQTFFLSTSISPLFPCLSFLFYCIVHIITPPPSFFVPWTTTSCPSTYFICSLEKSIFDIFPSAPLTLLVQIHFAQQYLSTSNFSFLLEYGWV